MRQTSFIAWAFIEKWVFQVVLEWLNYVPSFITKTRMLLPKNIPDFWLKQKAKFNTFASLIIHIYLWNLSQEVDNTQTKSLTHFDENLETFGEGST